MKPWEGKHFLDIVDALIKESEELKVEGMKYFPYASELLGRHFGITITIGSLIGALKEDYKSMYEKKVRIEMTDEEWIEARKPKIKLLAPYDPLKHGPESESKKEIIDEPQPNKTAKKKPAECDH